MEAQKTKEKSRVRQKKLNGNPPLHRARFCRTSYVFVASCKRAFIRKDCNLGQNLMMQRVAHFRIQHFNDHKN